MSEGLQRFSEPPPPADFLRVFNRLAVALREPIDASGVKAEIYREFLSDLSIHALVAGANKLARETGRKFFPTTAEWRAAAVDTQRKQLQAAVGDRSEERTWTHECDICDDTGWRKFQCDGTDRGFCRRTFKHYPHDYVEVCDCRPTNRTFIRHHQFGKSAEQ